MFRRAQDRPGKYIILALMLLLTAGLFGTERTMGVIKNDMNGWEGYTLFAPMDSGTTYLIDNYGRIIHTWESQYRPNYSVYLLGDGSLLKSIKTGDGNYGAEIMNWDGEVTWEFFYTGTLYYQHHDIEPMPNGNVLMIVKDIRPQSEFVAAGRDPSTISTARIWSEKIIEFQPSGLNSANIVWEWKVFDHLIQDFDKTKPNYGVVKDHPELLDINYTPNPLREWLHINSVDYNEELDQIVLSSYQLNEVWIVDHSTTTAEAAGHTGGNSGKGGDILYRWGNPKSYGAVNNNQQKLFRQHDARWIESGSPGEGNILIYNNGDGRPEGNYSSVIEIDTPTNSSYSYQMPLSGNSFGPVNPVWKYVADPPESMYSEHLSGSRRLPNGNTLICQAYGAHFYEVEPDSTVVWEYISPYLTLGGSGIQGDVPGPSSVFRCTRYSMDHPAFYGRDITPGGYIEINPITVESTLNTPARPFDIEDVTVTSKIYDDSGISSAELYAYFGSDSLIIAMNDNGIGSDMFAGDSVYTAVIPAVPGTERINYFIKITDGSKETFFDPPFASKDYYFRYETTSAIPENIDITRNPDSVTLSWDGIEGITGYKVYSSDEPYSGFSEDTGGTFDGASWSVQASEAKRFYYVVSVK